MQQRSKNKPGKGPKKIMSHPCSIVPPPHAKQFPTLICKQRVSICGKKLAHKVAHKSHTSKKAFASHKKQVCVDLLQQKSCQNPARKVARFMATEKLKHQHSHSSIGNI